MMMTARLPLMCLKPSINLITKIVELTKLSSVNIEDVTIVEMTTDIITLITSVTVVTMEEKSMISSIIITAKATVMTYLSTDLYCRVNKVASFRSHHFP